MVIGRDINSALYKIDIISIFDGKIPELQRKDNFHYVISEFYSFWKR
jgi:hypothetical protein